jgi:hypothetical protein
MALPSEVAADAGAAVLCPEEMGFETGMAIGLGGRRGRAGPPTRSFLQPRQELVPTLLLLRDLCFFP